MVAEVAFRNAMANLGAAVSIITSDGVSGLAGLTVSAVCSVSDTPPTLLVCINRNSRSFPVIRDNGKLCVNVLGSHHEQISNLFAGKAEIQDRFASVDWHAGSLGQPVIDDALVSFECEIDEVKDVGTHGVFMCRVKDIVVSDGGHGLIYFRRSYHAILSV